LFPGYLKVLSSLDILSFFALLSECKETFVQLGYLHLSNEIFYDPESQVITWIEPQMQFFGLIPSQALYYKGMAAPSITVFP